jgi:hypothetical protein
VIERIYYTRVVLGVIAGAIAGFTIQPNYGQEASVGVVFLIAVVFYFISIAVSRGIARLVPKDKTKKIATEGAIPFIFMIIVFTILIYTALHQSILVK